MKAIVKQNREVGLKLVNAPEPSVGPSDVLVRVRAATVCGSDFSIYNWNEQWTVATVKPGQIIGHEFCGTVADVGRSVTGLSIGELVTAEGHISCGTCIHCRSGEAHICPHQVLLGFNYPGAFAEYVVVPSSNIIRLGAMPLIIGALQDPFGNAVHSAMKTTMTNASVLITGCGPVGLMTIAVAKHSGAHSIFATEISPYRMDMATKMGADFVLNPTADDVESFVSKKNAASAGVDIFLEMSGSPDALRQGFKLLRPGGTAILLGLPKQPLTFDFSNDLIAKGVTVHGIIGRNQYRTWHQARNFLDHEHSGRTIDLSRLVTHRVLLDDFEKAFNLMQNGQAGKVVLFPDEESLQQSYDEIP